MILTQKQLNELKEIFQSLGLTIADGEVEQIGFQIAEFVLASEAKKS